MQKILMIGESDLLIESIYDALGADYKIQICEAVDTAVIRMAKIIKPNLIMIIKSVGVDSAFLSSIETKLTDIPIVCICAKDDSISNRHSCENVHFIFRPIKNTTLLEQINGFICGEQIVESSEEYGGLFVKKERAQILAIDDNPMVLRGLKQLLDVEYAVTVATSVKTAMGQVDKKKFDLILLDYEMPEINGLEAYKGFTSNSNTSDIPVVFLTGVSDAARIKEILVLNPKPAGYLLKPIDADLLKNTIKSILEK